MAVSRVENAVLGKGTLIRKEDKAYEVRYIYSLSEQPSTKVDTSNSHSFPSPAPSRDGGVEYAHRAELVIPTCGLETGCMQRFGY
jgi:hypothetical protein